MNSKYADMLNLPHHVSKKHPQMSIYDRAAQFAPFAALTGHSDAIEDTVVEHTQDIINKNTNEAFYD